MKTLFTALLVFLVLVKANSTILSDLDGILTDQEIQQLQSQCDEIQQTHGINFQIYFFSEYQEIAEPKQVTGNVSGIVQVLINRSDSSVVVKTADVSALRKTFFEQVFFQFLNVPIKEGSPIVSNLITTLAEVRSTLNQQKQVREQQQREREQLERFDPRAVTILWIFLGVFIISAITYRIKKERIQNKYEARSFYGVSRLPTWVIMLTGALLLFGGSYLILQHIATGGWLVFITFWVTFYPILVLISFLITVILDAFSLREFNTEDVKPTLGQMLWLVRSSSNTEHLMELTFYEQIIKKKINLKIDNTDYDRRRVVEFYVSPGEKFDSSASFKIDEAPFFLELNTTPEPLKPYLHQIYNGFSKFLVYRKDYVIKGLFRSGHLTKLGYLTNTFRLTPKGKELQKRLKDVEQEQADFIGQGIYDPSDIPKVLPKLTPHVLLIPDFEKRLTNFYNALVDTGFLDQAMALPIGFLFHPDFSLRAFNVRLRSAYASMVVRESGSDEGGGGFDWFD